MKLPAVEVVFAPEIQVSSCVFFSSGNPGCLRHGGFRPEIPKRWRFWDSWDLQKPKGSPSIFKEFRNSEGFMLMFIESTWITWKFTGLDFHLKSPQKVNNLNHCEWSQAFCSGKTKLLMHWCTCTSYMQLWCSDDICERFGTFFEADSFVEIEIVKTPTRTATECLDRTSNFPQMSFNYWFLLHPFAIDSFKSILPGKNSWTLPSK